MLLNKSEESQSGFEHLGVESVAVSSSDKLLPVLQVSNHWVVESDNNIL